MKYAAGFLIVALFAVAGCGTQSPGPISSPTRTASPTTEAARSASATPTATETTGLGSPKVALFRQYADAINRGDVSAALTVFADDVVWERGGQCPPGACLGKQAAQREVTRDIAAHHQLTLVGADTSGDPVVRLELRNDGTRRAIVERVIQLFAIELKGDKVSAVRVIFDLSDPVTSAFVASQSGTQR